MSSGGGKTQTQTTTNDPPAWAVPYFRQGLTMASNVANQPFQAYGGPLAAGQTYDQQAAGNIVRQNALGGSAVLDAGSGYVSSLMGGGQQFNQQRNAYEGATTGTNAYAGQNPYLDNMVSAASRDVTDAYTKSTVPNMLAQFQSGGAFGGTAMADAMSQSQQDLAGRLGDLNNQFRFQDYTTQQQLAESALGRQQADLARNASLNDSYLGRVQTGWDNDQARRLSAAGLAPQLDQARYYGANQLAQQGMQQQLTNQAGIDAQYDEFMRQQGWSQQQLQSLANTLGTVQGGSASQNVANPNYRSAGQNALTAAAIVASIWSDEDAKTDKKPMDPDKALQAIRAMPVDTWRYHGDTEQHAGTYSQDFYKALGMEPKEQINSIDMFGALAGAMQALDKKINKGAKA